MKRTTAEIYGPSLGKADIIFVIDSSGSMFDETTGIQQNMNAISSVIAGTGMDVPIVVVGAAGPALFGLIPPHGAWVAPLLRSNFVTQTKGLHSDLAASAKDTCQDHAGGWFFDNRRALSVVIACLTSRATTPTDQDAQIDIVFGRETKNCRAGAGSDGPMLHQNPPAPGLLEQKSA